MSTSAAMAVSVMLTLASIISVPIWTAILGLVFPTKLEASPFTVFSVVFPKIAIPFFLGWALREFAPVVAKRIEPYVGKVFWGLIALVLVGLILTSYRLVGQIHFVGFAAMVVVILASAFAGDLMGRPKLEDRMLLGSAAIYGNPAVALAIAHVNFPSLKLGPAVAVYILLRVVTFRPYILWMNYEYEHRPARLA
ncbi:MAG TPA: hypothetical protein VM432_01135 [Bdellovibrionales bacterium]|nr:hypothetical protein [Bdellovibrionales bacterium]